MPWSPYTDPQDYVTLAGVRSPGIAVVTGVDSPRRFDIRKGFARSGARAVYKGKDLSKPTITLRFFTVEHFNDWAKFKQLLDAPPIGASARALDISHPLLDDVGITAVQIQNRTAPQPVPGGEWQVVISTIEHRELGPVELGRIEGSTERATDPVDQEIEALTDEVRQLQRLAA